MSRLKLISAATIFIIIGLILGLTISSNLGIQSKGYTKHTPEISSETLGVLERYSSAMVEVVQAIKPSVVNISTSKIVTRKSGGGQNPLFNDPFFRRFFGDEFFKGNESPPQKEQRNGLGSGVIVSEDGYIITNNHVVKDADKITVMLSNNEEYEGKLIGVDPKTDLAVIKIEAADLPAIRWGDSDLLKVGEMVIAVGSPYGLMQTVTSGIVSAKGRANVRIADYEDFIQTDAAINPGNSGGPLINIRGELIGINTAIFSTSGGYQGIGFSIPSNMAKAVLDSLITDGKVTRGYLGVSIQVINKELAEQFDLKDITGTLVSDVVAGSPAEKAGIRRGDVIVTFNGRDVNSPLALRNIVASTRPDTKVKVKVLRDGDTLTLSIKVGELAEEEEQVYATADYDNVLKGVKVQDLTPEIREKLRISDRVDGVIVAETPQYSGFKLGDVIVEINKHPIHNATEYDEVVSNITADTRVLILLYRNGRMFYMTLSE